MIGYSMAAFASALVVAAVATERIRHRRVEHPDGVEVARAVATLGFLRQFRWFLFTLALVVLAGVAWQLATGATTASPALPGLALLLALAGWWLPREARARCRALGVGGAHHDEQQPDTRDPSRH